LHSHLRLRINAIDGSDVINRASGITFPAGSIIDIVVNTHFTPSKRIISHVDLLRCLALTSIVRNYLELTQATAMLQDHYNEKLLLDAHLDLHTGTSYPVLVHRTFPTCACDAEVILYQRTIYAVNTTFEVHFHPFCACTNVGAKCVHTDRVDSG
jgi:hypothetical protein